MDEGFSRAVIQVFVSLYNEGLIYRDYFLVNRCPHCRTVLSDIEIEHKDVRGKLWHIRYRVEGSDESVVVATTRPETMLGDTALAVHPDDERYAQPARQAGHPASPGPAPPGHHRRARRARLRDRSGQGHAGPRPCRLRARQEARPRADHRHRRLGQDDRGGGAGLRRARPLRRAGQGRRKAQGAGPARQDRGPRPRRRPLLPLPEHHRAPPLVAMVRPHQDPRRRGHPRRRGRLDRVHPGELGQDLLRVDVQHPRLVHLAPALVGPPHPGLVLPRLRPDHGGHGGPGEVRQVRRRARPGRGRPRHLVLLGPVALRDARLAGRDRGPADVLPDRPDVHGLRYHLLLGRPHDHDGPQVPGGDPVPPGVHQRPRPRPQAAEDEQVGRQHHRPAGDDRQVRDRRPALHPGRPGRTGHGPGPVRGAHGRLPGLRQQDLERLAVRADEPQVRASRGPGGGPRARRPLDPEPDERGDGRARRRASGSTSSTRRPTSSTISSGTSSATGTSSSPRSACAKGTRRPKRCWPTRSTAS